MRLRFKNRSGLPASEIEPLVRFAAKFFPTVTGAISIHVTKSRRLFGGMCYHHRTRIDISCRFTNEGLPWQRKNLGSFPQHEIPLAVPMPECRTWQDIFVMVAAHEFGHCTGPGTKWRKSRMERYCEARAAEVLAAFQTPEGQAEVAAMKAAMIQDAGKADEVAAERKAARGSPDAKLEHLAALKTKWERKAKLAATKLKKLRVRMKYWERKAAVGVAATKGDANV